MYIYAYVGLMDYFNPRSPCGERRKSRGSRRLLSAISIHALLAESDQSRVCAAIQTAHFNPRSPCGERHFTSEDFFQTETFQSTLSLRRATNCKMLSKEDVLISIHALLAESDRQVPHGHV